MIKLDKSTQSPALPSIYTAQKEHRVNYFSLPKPISQNHSNPTSGNGQLEQIDTIPDKTTKKKKTSETTPTIPRPNKKGKKQKHKKLERRRNEKYCGDKHTRKSSRRMCSGKKERSEMLERFNTAVSIARESRVGGFLIQYGFYDQSLTPSSYCADSHSLSLSC